jgi:hypothetical protein
MFRHVPWKPHDKKLLTLARSVICSAPPKEINRVDSKYFCSSPYLLRLGGFRRGLQDPYKTAEQIKEAGIRCVDNLGNGLFESLLLCRKYGISPTLEAPALGFKLPFLHGELPEFEKMYRKIVRRMKSNIALIESILKYELIGRKNQVWILWLRLSPLQLYLDAVNRMPVEVCREMSQEIGFSKAPTAETENPWCFWEYIRKRHMEVLSIMSKVFREEIVGEGIIVGNMHANPPVDYGMLKSIFDFPGVAVRPCYLEDMASHEAHVMFSVKVMRDLNGIAPLVSIRSNLLSAGIRFIPDKKILQSWYSAAVRCGISGFYLWSRDYPGDSSGKDYDGPMSGHPDPLARGPERWKTNLEIFSRLSTSARFNPPQAQVGIIFPSRGATAQHWLRVFDCFRNCVKSRVWVDLLDPSVNDKKRILSNYKVLLVPDFPFDYARLGISPEAFVKRNIYVLLPINSNDNTACTKVEYDSLIPERPQLLCSQNFYDEKDTGGAQKLLSEICRAARADTYSWVYDITLDSLISRPDNDNGNIFPEAENKIQLEHYYYEHSSDWILPVLSRQPEESF